MEDPNARVWIPGRVGLLIQAPERASTVPDRGPFEVPIYPQCTSLNAA